MKSIYDVICNQSTCLNQENGFCMAKIDNIIPNDKNQCKQSIYSIDFIENFYKIIELSKEIN